MRLLANENVPLEAVEVLRSAGHDIEWIRLLAPGSSDEEVLRRGVSENRVLVTFDKDFGELVFQRRLPSPPGIILFRFALSSPGYAARTSVAALASRTDWVGHFAVIEDARVRMTPLPAGAP